MTFTIYVCKVVIVLEMVMDVCHRSLEIFNRFGKKRAGFDINGCPGQVKCVFGQVKTAPNLPDGASENYSVICSIPEEQND